MIQFVIYLAILIPYESSYKNTIKFKSDLSIEPDKIKCQVLVLRTNFNSSDTAINYFMPQFIDSWDEASKKNPLIQVRDINNSGTFLWKDQPKMTYELIVTFIKELTK